MQIYAFHHKAVAYPVNPSIAPMQVGTALASSRLPMLHDDVGDNISDRNPNYCELTGIYWVWKHLQTQGGDGNVGFCHYRRYFSPALWLQQPSTEIASIDYDQFDSVLRRRDFILPTPEKLRYKRASLDVKDHYYICHVRDDWDVLRKMIAELHPEMAGAFARFERGHRLSCFNMFCCSRQHLSDYCDWLFPLLDAVRVELKISGYPYQRRVIGFMAERLLNFYVMYRQLSVHYCPVVQIES